MSDVEEEEGGKKLKAGEGEYMRGLQALFMLRQT